MSLVFVLKMSEFHAVSLSLRRVIHLIAGGMRFIYIAGKGLAKKAERRRGWQSLRC